MAKQRKAEQPDQRPGGHRETAVLADQVEGLRRQVENHEDRIAALEKKRK